MKTASAPKVLLIATTSFAGMGPYVASVVNSFNADDNVRFFLVEREDRYFSKNIRPDLKPLATIVMEKTPSKLSTLANIIFGGDFPYCSELKKLCGREDFDVIHAVSEFTDVNAAKSLTEKAAFIYTVHDLHPHEAKKVWFKRWRQNVVHGRIFKIIPMCRFLLTNSKSQMKELMKSYPSKRSFFADFPSLVTDDVASGTSVPPEIENIGDYILFFGRIEAYKGIDILLNAFRKMRGKADIKLVIAGKGEFDRHPEDNVVYIDRYIHDSEIAELYRRAKVVVYPYISGTQSGVLSIASYFSTPMIVSDIPFFREVLGDEYSMMFESGDSDALAALLLSVVNSPERLKFYSEQSSEVFRSHYNSVETREKLLSIYADALK